MKNILFRGRSIFKSANYRKSKMHDVYVSFKLPEKILQRLTTSGFKYACWNGPGIPPRQQFLENVKGVKGIICHLGVKVDSDVIKAAGSSLNTVSTMSVGYDHLDLKEMKARNIRVGYVPEILTDATAELTVSLLLMVSRKMREGNSIKYNHCI